VKQTGKAYSGNVLQFFPDQETGDEAENVRDNETGIGGLREGCLSRIAEAQAEAGEEKAALACAVKQPSAQLKTKALISFAKELARRELGENDSKDSR
jgi:hypothetical protein